MSDITFLKLLNDYEVEVSSGDKTKVDKIEIPKVQRDYAQGRESEDVQLKLDRILIDIKTAITERKQLNLNFVYGKLDSGKFIPMDGQQRLTLLFLLHLYAFSEDNSKDMLFKKFRYDTRDKSRRFVEKLIEKRGEVFNSTQCVDEKSSESSCNPVRCFIEDSAWFHHSWQYDPTIQSMLVVLDEIVRRFSEVKSSLASELEDDGIIVFKFLHMEKLGMEDSLYIKLNARGKPLTEFENYRAALIGRLRAVYKGDDDFVREFEKALDGRWTDLFWNLTRNDKVPWGDKLQKGKEKPTFDAAFLSLLYTIVINGSNSDEGNQETDSSIVKKIQQIDNLPNEIFKAICHTLEVFCKIDFNEMKFLGIPLGETPILECLVEVTNKNRVLLHAFTAYAVKTKGQVDSSEFAEWYRIIKNLTLNSDIDNPKEFANAVKSLNELSSRCQNINDYFGGIEPIKITGFLGAQIKEERLKAQLILKQGLPFEKAILKAEENPYFSGQIIGILNFSGFSNENNWQSESVEQLAERLELFKSYSKLFDAIFDGDGPKVDGVLLRRALLVLTDENTPLEQETLVANKVRGKSWKDFLGKDNPYRSAMESLFEKMVNRAEDQTIKEALQGIISSSTVEKSDWRYYLIDEDVSKGIFEVKDYYISQSVWKVVKEKERILLLTKSRFSGYYYDLDAVALCMLINSRRKGFSKIKVTSVWGRPDDVIDKISVTGITLKSDEKLRVKCSDKNTPRGLSIAQEDDSPPSVPFEEKGKTVDDVINYLVKIGYFDE